MNINGIEEDQNFRVSIPQQYGPNMGLSARLAYMLLIKEWVDELVGWQPDAYTMLHAHNYIDVWFRDSRHAMLCAIKWSA